MTAGRRVGRPRRVPDPVPEQSGRVQILDAAAALFSEHGVSATTTRAIAERVGIRQASLYHHFASKDDILAELLTTSVRPSLQVFARIQAEVARGVAPAGALFALALADIDTLRRAPHNIASLYLMPELRGHRFDAFRDERRELLRAYGELAVAVASDDVVSTVGADQLGALLMQVIELVIQLRTTGEVESVDADSIASSCLRVCGLDGPALDSAREEAADLMLTLGIPQYSPLHEDFFI